MKSFFTKLATILAAALFLFVAPHAHAQNTGSIAGTVTDAQGAIIPNAVITLTDKSEGRLETIKSNSKGEYLFTDVAIGNYTLKIVAPTFETFVVENIEVDASIDIREDAHMVAGNVATTVTINDNNASNIDLSSATVGTLIDPNLVSNLPIDGENIVSLAALLPGVSNVNAPTTFTSDTGGPTYSVSGSRSNQNLFLFDGIIWNNLFYNTGLNYPPRLALQEVSVLLNNYKAQYGRNSGSIFNVLTRAGGNAFHGYVWEYLQNTMFNAKDYMTGVNPHEVQNQFGGTIGGPIVRDKAFFFLSYQDLRLGGQVTARDQTYTLAELGYDAPGVPHICSSASPFAGQQCGNFAGDFCFMYNQQTCPLPVTPATAIRNPVYTEGAVAQSAMNSAYTQAGNTLAPGQNSPCFNEFQAYELAHQASSSLEEHFPTPELPVNCYSPVTTSFLAKYVPAATMTQPGSNNLIAISKAPQPRNDQEGLARVDVNLGRHTLDARFYVTNTNDITSNSVSQGQGVASYAQSLNVAGVYNGNIGDTWVITPNLLNVARAAYKRYTYIIIPQDRSTLATFGANYTQPGPSFLPKVEATGRFTVGSANSGDSHGINATVEFDDSLSWQHGTHNYQFGVQFLDLNYLHRFNQVPLFESEQQFTEVSMADLLMGFLYDTSVGNRTNLAARQYALYSYAQDDWRATARLTLNYGIRYEIPFSWKEVDGQGVTFIPSYQSVVFPNSPANVAFQGDPGIGNTSPSTKYNNVAPRVGFSYDAHGNGTLAIRGGFGIFFDSINANVVGVSEPYHYTASYTQAAGGFSIPLLGLPAIPQDYVKGQAIFTLPYTVNFADRNLRNSYTEAVNIGFQQKIKAATLEVDYVGKFGRKQIIPIDQNPAIYDCSPSGSYFIANASTYCTNAAATQASYLQRVQYPNFNYGGQGVVDNMSVGTSSYNGLQVIYSQRAAKFLTTYMSYTYARSIDLSSNGATNTANIPQPHHLNLEYAASDFNATQILNLGWIMSIPGVSSSTGWRSELFNDWKFGGIYNARTGNPVNVTLAGDVSLTDQRTQRPNLVPYQPLYPTGFRHRVDKVNAWFNAAAFSQPITGTFGNLRRNAVIGPAYINTNLDLEKVFSLPHPGQRIEFRVDAFNAFNTPNLAQPNASLSGSSSNSVASNYDTISATVGTNGSLGSNGRRLQFGLIFQY